MNTLWKLRQGLGALFLRLKKPSPAPEPALRPTLRRLVWGRKVSLAFRERLFEVAEELMVEPDHLMACIAFESAESFRPDIRNAAGSGAVGLIQFMPTTARALGTTSAELAAMSAERQLDYVLAYFMPYRGRLNSLGDVYMAILWPAGIGKANDWVLWDRDTKPAAYRQNSGLDLDRDGRVTKGEAVAMVEAKLKRGRLPAFIWEGV
ncbi:transglycosylase SLT domain-containing protein [Alcaligenes sp. WGS1538]|uniref:transglycosylase SLT domain-containing protein n=1 Tax=Alcaligenes sp. WGS1538 TaxID=3366811 RepID=UPI00372D0C0A